jgi:hypothetical protein
MNADGSGVINVTRDSERPPPPDGNDPSNTEPTWSPDGTQLAFYKTHVPEGGLWIVQLETLEQRKLTGGPGTDNLPAWSPDGLQIAWDRTFTDPNNVDDSEIFLINPLNPSQQTNITNNPALDFEPNWSPDGNRIAFSSNRDDNNGYGDTGRQDIFTMTPAGTDITNLTRAHGVDEVQAAWSPDGRRILFRVAVNPSEIYSMATDGSAVRAVTNSSMLGPPYTFVAQGPDWQPAIASSPTRVTIKVGVLRAGGAGSLAADDTDYFEVNAIHSRRTVTWYATFPAVPNDLNYLGLTYLGAESAPCKQTLSIFRWTDTTWVKQNTQTVGPSMVEITANPAGLLANYVRGTTGPGEVRVRLTCRRRDSIDFHSVANLLGLAYTTS